VIEDKPTAYRGVRRSGKATIEAQTTEGAWRELPLRLDLWAHSPSGFEWGYGGSGPAQAALAIVASRVNGVVAIEVHQEFKWAVVADLPTAGWELTADKVDGIISQIRAGEVFHP